MSDNVEMFVTLISKGDGSWIVDPQLRPKLVADAVDQGVSLGDFVNAILAKKYGVEFETTPRRTTPEPDKDHLRFQMPPALHRKIAARTPHPLKVNDSVRAALSEHYGLPAPVKSRSGRRAS